MKTIEQIISETPDATDAEILAAAEASREYRRVPADEVKLWLLSNNLLGKLIVVRDTTSDAQVKGGLSELLTGLDFYNSLDATDVTIRTKALTLAGGLALAGVITGEQATSFIELLKEPSTINQDAIDRYRRRVLIQSHIDAAAQAAANANAFASTAQGWIENGEGEMPTWGQD